MKGSGRVMDAIRGGVVHISGATSALHEVRAYLDEVAITERGLTWERASRAVRGLEGVVRGERAVTRICKQCQSTFILTAEAKLEPTPAQVATEALAAEKTAAIDKAEAALQAAEEALVSARAEMDDVNAKVRRCREAQKLALRTLRALTGTAGPKRPATPAMVAHGKRSWEEPTEANGWTPGCLFRKFKLAAWLEVHPGHTVADPSPATSSYKD